MDVRLWMLVSHNVELFSAKQKTLTVIEIQNLLHLPGMLTLQVELKILFLRMFDTKSIYPIRVYALTSGPVASHIYIHVHKD